MKTLVIGNNYVSSFFTQFPEQYDVWKKTRLDEYPEWQYLLAEYDTIVNCHETTTGTLRQMMIENFEFAYMLYEHCNKYGQNFVQLSTADLYSGRFTWEQNIETSQKLNISNDYFLSKRVIERYLENANALTLRIKNPFDDRNHEDNWIIKGLKKPQACNIVDNQTYLPDFKKVIEGLIEQKQIGLFNVVQSDAKSELFYFRHTLELPRYKHLDVHMKEHTDIDNKLSEDITQADVNSTKIQGFIPLMCMTSAVVISWENLKNVVDNSIYTAKLGA